MAEENNKKISFGFSKSIKKPTLLNKKPEKELQVDYIECIDERQIRSINAPEPQETGPRVIPLVGSKTWHERFTNKVNADIYNSNTTVNSNNASINVPVIKQEPIDVDSVNGDANPSIKVEPVEIKSEPDEVQSQISLDEMAANELLEDLKAGVKVENNVSNIVIPINREDLTGTAEDPLHLQIRNLHNLVQEVHSLTQNYNNSSQLRNNRRPSKSRYRPNRRPASSQTDIYIIQERHNSFLTRKEYEILEKFILDSAKVGFCWRFSVLLHSVKYIVRENGREPFFTPQWLQEYLKTKPIFSDSKAETLKKLKFDNQQQKEAWYLDLKSYLESKNASDIAFDKSRLFYCGQIEVETYPYHVMTTISADGSVMPSMVTYSNDPGAPLTPPVVPEKWVIYPSNYNGISIDNLFHYIIMVLHPYLCQQNVKFPVLLFLDGRKFAISMKLWKSCEERGIILYCLPGSIVKAIHESEGSIFLHCHKRWIEKTLFYQQTNSWYYMITNFLALFNLVFQSVVQPESVKVTFKQKDIFPENIFPPIRQFNKVLNIYNRDIMNNSIHDMITYEDYISTKKVIENFVGRRQVENYESMRARNVNHQGYLYQLWKLSTDIATSAKPHEYDINANDVRLNDGNNNQQNKSPENEVWDCDDSYNYQPSFQSKKRKKGGRDYGMSRMKKQRIR